MSEEVAKDPPAEILPAKSEDKLEIEKEEAAEKKEEKTEAESGEDKKPSETEEEAKDGGDKKEEAAEDTAEAGGEEKKKGFKMPNVNLKLPKVPGVLRSLSKDRNKDKAGDGEDAKKEGEEGEEGAEKKEGEEAEGGEQAEEGSKKDAKARVKEAMENIHMPKIPKIHKPAFLKKKKGDGGEAAAEGEDAGEDKDPEDKKEGEEEGEGEKKEGAEGEDAEAGEASEKKDAKKKILDNLKSVKDHVHMPAFLSKSKSSKKEKDAEAGDQEESKELLEKKEGEAGGEKKEGEEGEEATTKEDEEAKDSKGSKGAAILESLRNVASQVPSLFKKSDKGNKEVDVEAGGEKEESKELLEKKEGGDELEEVKVVSEEGGGKKDPEAGSQTSEKKDPEKPYCKYLNRAKEAKAACEARYNELDRQKQLGVLGVIGGILFLLFIIILIAICSPSDWSNDYRISDCGKYVTTHTTCGPVQGLVEEWNQFSFRRIPYGVPVMNSDRWTHSQPTMTLTDCHEGTLKAHSHNESSTGGSCWRRYPDGADGDENCLTLDIYTSSVTYNDLMPVVVYIDGDDLSEEEEARLQPSASLAYNHSTVFVSVNYRRGVLGFLSLNSLSQRSVTKASGNYGLGDIVSALKWLKLNIQHFGGHPSQITLLGRGSGATLVTALTAVPKAKGLFKQAWATNGAGVYENKTLEMANKENKAVLQALNCGSDEVECLIDATAEDLTNASPYEWRDTNMVELPQVGEKGHSWLVVDKYLLLEHPKDFWKENQFSNKIPLVFGSTAQGEVTNDTRDFMDWNDKDKYEAHVEGKLGSFNVTIPGQAMKLYNVSDHWLEYASMVSDIRTVCPIQDLADYVSHNFMSDVYSYVATHKRSGIADSTIDVAAIFGTYTEEAGQAFVSNMQDAFFTFVRTGKMPQDKDLSLGMYTIDDTISAQRNYPKCDFWKNAQSIVPNYANLD